MEDFFEEGAVESGNEEDNDYEEDEDSGEYEDDIGCEDVDVHDNKTENALKDAQDADDRHRPSSIENQTTFGKCLTGNLCILSNYFVM